MLQELRLNDTLRTEILDARKGSRLEVGPSLRRDTARTGQLLIHELTKRAYDAETTAPFDTHRYWMDEHGVIACGEEIVGHYIASGRTEQHFQNGAFRFGRFGFEAVNVAVWHDVAEIGFRLLFCPSRHAAIQNARAASCAPQRRYMLPPLPFMPTH